jgi:DNA-directed RNA polymerase specialized sigma24 family protein
VYFVRAPADLPSRFSSVASSVRGVEDKTQRAAELPGKSASAFPVTQWSMVLRAGAATDTQAHAALEALCRRYWHPLYAFVRCQGRDHHEAEDCTQEFLAQVLAGGGLQHARPARGRFRTFLLTSLRNFLTSEWRRTHAAKRGGGIEAVSLSPIEPDARPVDEPRDPGLTPEQAFDRTWALGLIDRGVSEVRAEYQRSGRGAVFDALAPFVWGSAGRESISQQATHFGMTAQTFTVALHRARRRLGERLRAMVAETVDHPAEVDAELRHLLGALNGTVSRR